MTQGTNITSFPYFKYIARAKILLKIRKMRYIRTTEADTFKQKLEDFQRRHPDLYILLNLGLSFLLLALLYVLLFKLRGT